MSSILQGPTTGVDGGESDFLSPTSRDGDADNGPTTATILREPRVNMADGDNDNQQAGAISVQLSSRMPHPFDGTTDFRSWLRRYEAAADAAQWSERSRASRLGMYLEEDFFDSWVELAGKTNWKADKALMLSLFAQRSPDEALQAFNALTWDGHQRFVVFAARLGRCLKEYNQSLPEGQRMSAEAMSRQVFDRCVVVAPEGAQQELRKQQDHSIRAICSIVDDYSPGAAAKDGRMTSRYPVTAGSQPVAADVGEVLQAVLAPIMESLAGIIARLDAQQGFDEADGDNVSRGCGNCGGGHPALVCPTKAFDSGCFKCGKAGHFARDCPFHSKPTSPGN